MTQYQGQEIAAFGIVAGAAIVVGRRILSQVSAFRTAPKAGGACGGCESAPSKEGKRPPQLVQLQTRPPLRMRRPDARE